MKKLGKKIVALLLALSLAALAGGCAPKTPAAETTPVPQQSSGVEVPPAAEKPEPMQLSFATHLPETAIDGASLKYFFDEVSKETDGLLTFDCYFAGSLVNATDSLTSVSGGLVDIAFVPEGFFETQLYPTFVATIPYTTTSEWVTNNALNEMFQTYEPFQKMCADQGVVNLGVVAPSELSMCSNKKIESMSDLTGLKIRAMGAVNSDMSKLGATPVGMGANEIYEALERTTVDAATGIPLTLAVSYKLQEISDYFIFTGYGMYTTSSIYMNKGVYDKLPEAYKQAFQTVYDRFVDEYSSEDWMGGALKDSIKAIEDAGGEIVVLSAEERAKWADALAVDTQEFVDTATSYGYNGQEILDTYRALIEKYTPDDIAYQIYK